MDLNQKTVSEYDDIFGHKVEVVGCWDNKTPRGRYDFFDIYVDGNDDPINLGSPYYSMTGDYPTKSEIMQYLYKYLSVN